MDNIQALYAPAAVVQPGNGNGRLPPYCEKHRHRYHPYARLAPPPPVDLMHTVDYRYVVTETGAMGLATSLPAIREVDEEEDVANLERALRGSSSGKRLSLLSVVIELALAVRRQFHKAKNPSRTAKEGLLE